MGLLAWLRRHDAGLLPTTDTHLAPDVDSHEDLFDGLYLGQAVQGHLAWKKRLKSIVLEGRHDDVDIAQVAPDDLCTLGQWLHGHARQRYGHLPEYARLRKIHAEFHLTAGQVLINSRNGQREQAERLLRGAFSALSDQVQLELVRLYSAARTG